MFGFIGRLAQSVNPNTAAKFVRGELVDGVDPFELARRAGRYYLHNVPRTIGEIASCFTADIREPVDRLTHELGVKVGVLYFGDDRLVPSKEDIVAKTRKIVHAYEILEGLGHLAPQQQAARVAGAIADISEHLEAA